MAGGILKNDQNYDHVGSDEPQNMQGFGEKAVRRAFIRKVGIKAILETFELQFDFSRFTAF